MPRDLVTTVRRLDEGQLRQLLILARGLLLTSEAPVLEVDGVPGMPTVRYRQRQVACGKRTCTACPHGPYWYAHWTEDGRRRSRYIGAELSADVRRKLDELDRLRAPVDADVPAEPADASVALAAAGGGGGGGPATRRGLRLVRD